MWSCLFLICPTALQQKPDHSVYLLAVVHLLELHRQMIKTSRWRAMKCQGSENSRTTSAGTRGPEIRPANLKQVTSLRWQLRRLQGNASSPVHAVVLAMEAMRRRQDSLYIHGFRSGPSTIHASSVPLVSLPKEVCVSCRCGGQKDTQHGSGGNMETSRSVKGGG